MGSPFRVRLARDPQLDAWRGAAALCAHAPFDQIFITRAEWEEKGADYLKEHALANLYVPTAPEELPDAVKRRKRGFGP